MLEQETMDEYVTATDFLPLGTTRLITISRFLDYR